MAINGMAADIKSQEEVKAENLRIEPYSAQLYRVADTLGTMQADRRIIAMVPILKQKYSIDQITFFVDFWLSSQKTFPALSDIYAKLGGNRVYRPCECDNQEGVSVDIEKMFSEYKYPEWRLASIIALNEILDNYCAEPIKPKLCCYLADKFSINGEGRIRRIRDLIGDSGISIPAVLTNGEIEILKQRLANNGELPARTEYFQIENRFDEPRLFDCKTEDKELFKKLLDEGARIQRESCPDPPKEAKKTKLNRIDDWQRAAAGEAVYDRNESIEF